jgi:hypothetical protein
VVAAAALGRDHVEPIAIHGVAHVGKDSRVDEYAGAVVKFEGDIIAHLTCGTTVGVGQKMTIFGSKGSIHVPAPWLMAESATITVRVDDKEPRDEIVTTHKHPYAYEVDACAQFLEQHNPPAPYMSWEDSIGMQRSLDTWRESVGLRFDEEDAEDALARPVTGVPLARFADAPMTTARVAGIDKDISRLVMGSMIYNPRRQAFANYMLDYFYELGGNAIDTAHIYGGGQAEVAIGNWIRQRGIRELQQGVGPLRDRLVDLARVVMPDGRTVAEIPPVLHVPPRPFRHVKHVVAETREAAVHARVDAVDRRAHQRHRHDADDHAERGERRAQLVRPDLRKRDPEGLVDLVVKTAHGGDQRLETRD